VTCTGGAITAIQKTRQLEFVLVAPPGVGTITNTVTVDPNNAIFEADETNNTATQSTNITTGIDLVIFKSDNGPTSAVPVDPPGGGTVGEGFDPVATNGTDTYTIIVDNVGTQDSTGIKVRDTLPAGTKFLSVTSDRGFTCSHDGAATGGNVTCISGHLFGTESEFYDPPGLAGPTASDDFATIKIKVFVTPFVQPIMHNEVRVDPDNEIAEVNELNNLAFDNTKVGVGDADVGAFNQLKIAKTQTSPAGGPVATNGTLIYNLHVTNAGTDPVSNVVVKDFLPSGSRFISAGDTALGSAAFFCTHDGAATGGVITCTGGDFSGSLNSIPAVPIDRDIRVKIFAPSVPADYTNHATVDPDNIVPEGNEFDNDAFFTTTVGPCVGASQCGEQNAFYELTIDKTQVKPQNAGNHVARNGIITYNLKVSNLGSDPVHSVTATDRLPAGFRFIDAKDTAGPGDPNAFTCAGPDGSGVVTCSGGSLSGTVTTLGGAPTFRTIAIRVFAPDTPGTYTNNAFVDPNNAVPEGNEFNNQASLDTVVENGGPGPYIDLKVEKTQTFPDPTANTSVAPGGGIQYQLHVSNSGEGDAFNVTVADALPQHVTFHNARDAVPNTAGAFSCAYTGGTLTCTGGTIPTGGSRDILVNVTADSSIDHFALDQADVHILITNQAIVDPNNTIPEGDETNNTSSVDTTIKPPLDLTIEKQGPGSATANENTTYTITVHNVTKVAPGATATNVVVVDPLPTGLIPLNAEATGNFHCDLQENPVNKYTCTGDLQAGTDATITITAFVTLQSGELDNEACVDPADTIAETDETNNCKTTFGTVSQPKPDIQINKVADTNTVTAGQALKYTLNVSNVGTGPTDGSAVKVTDDVPADVTVDQVQTPAGWDCSATIGNNVKCETPSMNAGDAASIVINTTVNAPTSPFTNTASVDGGGDAQSNNNTSSVTTQVGTASAIDLHAVSLTGTPDPVNHDNVLTFTGIVTNDGTSDSGPGAIVRVVLPDTGVSDRAVTASAGFTCGVDVSDSSGKTFNCTGDFAPSGSSGSSTTITATMKVDHVAPPPATLTATMTADPGNAIVESDELNNEQDATVSVSGTVCGGSPCVDLFASMTGTVVVPTPGSPASYTAIVTNTGTTPVPDNPAWTVRFMFLGIGSIVSVVPIGTTGVSCAPVGATVTDCKGTVNSGDSMDLAPGASVQFQVTVLDLQPAFTFATMQVFADSATQVAELNEGNNVAVVLTGTTGP
jgi:uncharacterized repeat protein (TIGR01451 family)